jgi:putative sigma-54 modulation protein
VDVVIAYGRNIVSEEMRALTREKVARLAHRCPGIDGAEVRFSEEHNPRIAERDRCEVLVSVHGRTVRAHAVGFNPLAAVDRAVEKLEHQLETVKSRLVGRSQPRHRPAKPAASLYQRVRTA